MFQIKTHKNSTLPQFSEMKQGETIATMHTSMGDIVFRFFPQYAPKAVENFLTHAKMAITTMWNFTEL